MGNQKGNAREGGGRRAVALASSFRTLVRGLGQALTAVSRNPDLAWLGQRVHGLRRTNEPVSQSISQASSQSVSRSRNWASGRFLATDVADLPPRDLLDKSSDLPPAR